MTDKELLSIFEEMKKFWGTLFGYEIIMFSDRNNLLYSDNQSEYQQVMHWRLMLKYFGLNIKHIAGDENTVYENLSLLPSKKQPGRD